MLFKARAILMLDGDYVSDHSRSPLQVDFEPIENANRTVKGNMRVYEVAKKATLSTSWENLPSRASLTVDGYMGGTELEALYLRGGEVRVQIWNDLAASKSVSAARVDFPGRIKSFDYTIEKRNLGSVYYDFWNASITIEEL
jgi:hypothetical protein